MDRCCQTANLTFSGLELPSDRPFNPVIKEVSPDCIPLAYRSEAEKLRQQLVREALGVHTCDRRSTKSIISSRWPDFIFEVNFAEEDPLWVADLRESDSQLDHRVKTLLDDVFAHDTNDFISLTSHSGAIAGFLRVLGHERFSLQTGGVIPVLVKCEKVPGRAPPMKIEPGIPPPSCDAPPPPKAVG